jgi:hypothetical protein
MPNGFGPPAVDFSALANLPDAFYQGRQMRRERDMRQAFANGLPRDASGALDYDAMVNMMAQYDPKSAFDMAATAAKRNSMTPYEAGRLAIAQADLDRKLATSQQPPKLTSTDKKAIFDAEDASATLSGTVESLSRAKELNDKTYSGFMAGTRATIGAKAPAWMQDFIPDEFADPETAKATNEWQLLMSPEAIKQMSASLKGATTDFELRRFEALLADPSTPAETRARVIDRMLSLANRQLEINNSRLNDLRAGTYYQPGGGASAAPNMQQQQQPAPVPSDPSKLEVGKAYQAPDGRVGVWTGQGFVVQ